MAIPPGHNNNECIDHPLSDVADSSWRTFFKDNEVLLQIDKDVRRLCPDISFFQQVSSIYTILYMCNKIIILFLY